MLKSLGKGLLKGTANVLNRLADNEPTTPEDMIAKQVRSQLLKDQDLQLVLHTFKTKYGLELRNVDVKPVVSPGTLNIKSWRAVVRGVTIYEGAGLDDIYQYFCEAVLTKDQEKINYIITQLEMALAQS